MFGQRIGYHAWASLGNLQGMSYGRDGENRIGNRSKLDKENAVGKTLLHPAADFLREPSFPSSADAGQRDQPNVFTAKQSENICRFLFASDHRRPRIRKISGAPSQNGRKGLG